MLAKDLRRHTDPPALWVAVVIGSVVLHLLAFWLIRSYKLQLLSQQQSKGMIAIDFVEISPKTKSTASAKPVVSQPKPAPPKPVTTTQKLAKPVVPTQKLTTKTTPTVEDTTAIALAQQRQLEIAQQRQRELAQKSQREIAQQQLQLKLALQRQRELELERQRQLEAQQRQRELAQQQRQRELEAQQRQQEAEQRQRELEAQQRQQEAEQRQRELEAQQRQQEAEQRQRELEAQQRENAGNIDNPESLPPPSNVTGGSLIASLVGEPQQGERDRHTNPAKIKPSNKPFSKGLEYTKFIEQKPGEPVELTVILTISERGKLEHVAIADEAISAERKTEYEEFVTNEVLKYWEFEPAYDIDPKDPKPSNIKVRIRIQPLP